MGLVPHQSAGISRKPSSGLTIIARDKNTVLVRVNSSPIEWRLTHS